MRLDWHLCTCPHTQTHHWFLRNGTRSARQEEHRAQSRTLDDEVEILWLFISTGWLWGCFNCCALSWLTYTHRNCVWVEGGPDANQITVSIRPQTTSLRSQFGGGGFIYSISLTLFPVDPGHFGIKMCSIWLWCVTWLEGDVCRRSSKHRPPPPPVPLTNIIRALHTCLVPQLNNPWHTCMQTHRHRSTS